MNSFHFENILYCNFIPYYAKLNYLQMRFIFSFFIFLLLFSCNNNSNTPDVSNIKIELSVQRFEQEFFVLDSSQMEAGFNKLQKDFPSFSNIYFAHILNADPRWSVDSLNSYCYGFINAYKFVYDSANKVFKDFTPYKEELEKGMQYVKYYFPTYDAPSKIITYIGPLDGYGDILDQDALIVGLQHHLGANFSGYQMPWAIQTYPTYISSRFTPATISVNAFKNIVQDLYPEKNEDKALLIQMIEKGKHLYLLKSFLPFKEDYLLIGYSKEQFEESKKRENVIWDMFVQNNFLRTIDINIIKNYIGESPKTQVLGESSPGNIGSFSGWQIVNKFMEKFPDTKIADLMNLDPEVLFEKTKYKP